MSASTDHTSMGHEGSHGSDHARSRIAELRGQGRPLDAQTSDLVLTILDRTLAAHERTASIMADTAGVIRTLSDHLDKVTVGLGTLITKVDRVLEHQTTTFQAVREGKWGALLMFVGRNKAWLLAALMGGALVIQSLWYAGARPADFGVEVRSQPGTVRVQTGEAPRGSNIPLNGEQR